MTHVGGISRHKKVENSQPKEETGSKCLTQSMRRKNQLVFLQTGWLKVCTTRVSQFINAFHITLTFAMIKQTGITTYIDILVVDFSQNTNCFLFFQSKIG